MNKPIELDCQKRDTLKKLTGITAISVSSSLSAFPALTVAADSFETVQQSTPAIEVTLVSMPDNLGNTLVLRNLTDKDISIHAFHSGKLLFDGDVIDCNDACVNNDILVPATQKVFVRFKPVFAKNLDLPQSNYLAIKTGIRLLPEGTRVVSLNTHMHASTAFLSERLENLAA